MDVIALGRGHGWLGVQMHWVGGSGGGGRQNKYFAVQTMLAFHDVFQWQRRPSLLLHLHNTDAAGEQRRAKPPTMDSFVRDGRPSRRIAAQQIFTSILIFFFFYCILRRSEGWKKMYQPSNSPRLCCRFNNSSRYIKKKRQRKMGTSGFFILLFKHCSFSFLL